MTEKWWEAAPVLEPRAAPAGEDWWSEVPKAPMAEPATFGEKATAAAAGFNVGALANTLGLPVDVVNFLVGRARGAADPEHVPGRVPERPPGQPIGGSEFLRDLLTSAGAGYERLGDLPRELQPYARAGEVVGESAVPAGGALGAARAGLRGGRLTRPVLEAVRRQPGTFAVIEGIGAVGAGLGAGVAEAVAPGDPLAALAGEVGGGVIASLSPTAMIARGWGRIAGLPGRLAATVSPGARESQAARYLTEAITAAGEDPAILVRQLEMPPDVSGLDMTPAQQTQSMALLGIERKLAKDVPLLSNRLQARLRHTTEALNNAYLSAAEGGDKELLRFIAKERARWFERLTTARLAAAEQQAFDLAEGLRPGVARGEAGMSARATLEDAVRDARGAERALWETVPREVQIDPDNLRAAYNRVWESLLPEENMPAPIEAFMKRVDSEPDSITSGDLMRLRSRVLEFQRDARSGATPNWGLNRRLGWLADGALDDLSGLPGSEEARAFSRRLNDLFSRGEAGRVLGRTGTGAVRIAPEETLQATVGRGGLAGARASRELEEAAGLRGLEGEQLTRRTTIPEQEQFLRRMIEDTFDSEGRVDPRALKRFRARNTELLQQFPDLNMALRNAGDAQSFATDMNRIKKQADKAVAGRAAFARLSGFEDPTQAIGQALTSAEPITEYSRIANMARRGGAEGLAGLRQATIESLLDRATMPNGMLSGRRLREMLTKETRRLNLFKTMQARRVITPKQAKSLMAITEAAEKVENAFMSRARLDDFLQGDVNALEDFATRIAGANVGGMSVAGQITGAPLVAAQAGSQFARNLAQKLPVARTKEILVKAVEDPQYMAALLSKGETSKKRAEAARQIYAWLLQTAVPGSEEEAQEGP